MVVSGLIKKQIVESVSWHLMLCLVKDTWKVMDEFII